MADVIWWELVRDNPQDEQRLVSLPSVTRLEDAQQILLRLRVMGNDIGRGQADIQDDQPRARFNALKLQAIFITDPILQQLSPAERRQRRNIFLQTRSAVIAMNADTFNDAARQNWLRAWRSVFHYIIREGIEEEVSVQMYEWMTIALYRIGWIEGMTEEEHRHIAVLAAGFQRELWAQVRSGEFAPDDDEQEQLVTLFQILANVEIPALPQNVGLGFRFLHPGWDGVSQAAIVEGILACFPAVDIETLPADHRTCHICLEEYGAAEGKDKEKCHPRALTCCLPMSLGHVCAVSWFSRNTPGSRKCPTCKKDWSSAIHDSVMDAFVREGM